MFPVPPPTEDERLNGEQARIRIERAKRDATRPTTRDQMRSRRKRDVRASSINVARMPARELWLGKQLYPTPEDAPPRPRKRAECVDGVRPCPYVSCKHHLYLDVSARNGTIKLNFPDLEVDELAESCALDVADQGGATLERTGALVNLTRERVRQMEVKSLAKALATAETLSLRDFVSGGGPVGKRRLPMLSAEDDEDESDEDQTDGYEGAHGQAGLDVDQFASDALDAE